MWRRPRTADRASLNDRVAVFLTRVIGTMPMFYALIVWYGLWIGVNLFLGPRAFDKPWSFPTLLFASNFLQLIWLPAISVGQNVLGRAGERRDQEQFRMTQQIDQLTQEQHTMMGAQRAMLDALTALSEEMLRVLRAVADKTTEIDAEVDALTAYEQQARTLLASGGADE